MTPRFIDVLVDEHDQIPKGCCLRFQTLQEPRAAWAALVEDSGAGSAIFIYGEELGLRLRPVDGGEMIEEPYLLLAHEAVFD